MLNMSGTWADLDEDWACVAEQQCRQAWDVVDPDLSISDFTRASVIMEYLDTEFAECFLPGWDAEARVILRDFDLIGYVL